MKFLSRKKKEEGSLDAPSSLPDSLAEKFGVSNPEKTSPKQEDAKRIPDDVALNEPIQKLPASFEEPSMPEEPRMPQDKPVAQESVPVDDDVSEEEGVDEKETSVSRPSFFGELEKRFMNKRPGLHEHVSHGLVGLMREFHESKAAGGHFFLHEDDVDASLYKRMLELKELEAEWLVRMKEFNAAKELLLEKEREIESKSDALRKLLRHSDKFRLFNKRVSSGNAFKLDNGVVLHSIRDLFHELPSLDDTVFGHHVNNVRNDFADWILHVFGNKKLADVVRGVSSKDDLINVLKEY